MSRGGRDESEESIKRSKELDMKVNHEKYRQQVLENKYLLSQR